MDLPSHRSDDVPGLPTEITYESVPGRWGYWTATVETSAGRISATRPSLHETREALESQLRKLYSSPVRKVRGRGQGDRLEDCA